MAGECGLGTERVPTWQGNVARQSERLATAPTCLASHIAPPQMRARVHQI